MMLKENVYFPDLKHFKQKTRYTNVEVVKARALTWSSNIGSAVLPL